MAKGSKRRKVLKDEDELNPQTNPFFVVLIFENILSYLKYPNPSSSLKEYRLVCKFWDQEIIKVIRRHTHIQLERILTPYPEGFGWSAVENENEFQYGVPYQQVASFENVEVVLQKLVKHNEYTNANFENWFKVMGHLVKSLIYTCSLKTCQNKNCTTLERILKDWCPNLKRLTIKNIQCLKGLIFTSLFEDSRTDIICKNLSELQIKMDLLEDFTWPNSAKIPNILVDTTDFNQFIYNHGIPGINYQFPKMFNSAGIKVTAPKELYTNTELPDLSSVIPENFFPRYLDGGILGQLLKSTNMKKFTMSGPIGSANRKQLMALFHYRQNNWRRSLKHLEINLKVPVLDSIAKQLVLLGKMKFPIVELKVSFDQEMFKTVRANFTRFLSSFSETLEQLDIDLRGYFSDDMLVLPFLPKLKIFIINKIIDYKLKAANLVENAPNLEKCHLTDNDIFSTGDLDAFFDNNMFTIETLKDFRLSLGKAYFTAEQASKLLGWFPKVKRLELTGMMDENIGVQGFLEKLGNTEVTDFKMKWCKKSESRVISDIVASNTALIMQTGKLQNLLSLELNYADEILPIPAIPFHVMPIAFRDGFGKLPNLRFLKLTNFGVLMRNKLEVQEYIKNIPLVRICTMDYIRGTATWEKNEKLKKLMSVYFGKRGYCCYSNL